MAAECWIPEHFSDNTIRVKRQYWGHRLIRTKLDAGSDRREHQTGYDYPSANAGACPRTWAHNTPGRWARDFLASLAHADEPGVQVGLLRRRRASVAAWVTVAYAARAVVDPVDVRRATRRRGRAGTRSGVRRHDAAVRHLVVTDLSHLGVGLDVRGDFRGPLRFAVSSKPSRPSRRCDRVSTWCAGSASAVSRVR